MRRTLPLAAAASIGAALLLALAPTGAAGRLTMRYCEPPDLAGAYTAATPNVECETALAVVHGITRRRCWNREQCDVRGFVCIAYWSGSFTRPFSYAHHGICVARRQRRIEFDLS